MKKIIAVVLALFLVTGLLPVLAEENAIPDYSGLWTDPAFDRAEIVILRDFEAWTTDLLGEKPSGQYVISMKWSNSADSYDSYRMVAREEGKSLVYDNGLYVRCTIVDSDNGSAEFPEDQGQGRFTLTDGGVLQWEDSYVSDAAAMKLTRETAPAPSAETLLKGYYQIIASLENGTAGASLKEAQAVCDLYAFCMENRLWLTETEELGRNMLAAREQLSEKELAAFDANEPAVSAEALRLLKEEEKLTDAYYDAGVAERLEALRDDITIRSGVSFFLACVMTLENIGEP